MKFVNLPLVWLRSAGLVFALLIQCAWADQLVYVPLNPTFGGNPLNAAGLQANAAAQNNHKAPPVEGLTKLEQFQNQLQSAILSRIISNASTDLFGNSAVDLTKDRTYVAGNYVIAVHVDPVTKIVTMTTSDSTIPNSATTITLGNVASLNP